MFTRDNAEMELTVNRGIFIALQEGALKGASFMAEHKVPFDVARRVLLKPRLRRDTDWR